MQIDNRLNDIDDCLYRVAIRAIIIKNNKVLSVQEADDLWWALPGGGVDHSESIETTLIREIEEELGVPAKNIESNFEIVHYNIGNVVNGVPRMNLFFKSIITAEPTDKTNHIAKFGWFSKKEFVELEMHPSYDKSILTDVIFG